MAELQRLSHISGAYYGSRHCAMCGSGGALGLIWDNERSLSPIPRLYNTFMTCGAFLLDAIIAAPRGAESGGLLSKFIGESQKRTTVAKTSGDDGDQRKGPKLHVFVIFNALEPHKAPAPPGCLVTPLEAVNDTPALIIDKMEIYYIQISSTI